MEREERGAAWNQLGVGYGQVSAAQAYGAWAKPQGVSLNWRPRELAGLGRWPPDANLESSGAVATIRVYLEDVARRHR